MTEEERLGKLAYETFLAARRKLTGPDDIEAWEVQEEQWKRAWIAVGRAIAEQVLAEVVANEASGA